MCFIHLVVLICCKLSIHSVKVQSFMFVLTPPFFPPHFRATGSYFKTLFFFRRGFHRQVGKYPFRSFSLLLQCGLSNLTILSALHLYYRAQKQCLNSLISYLVLFSYLVDIIHLLRIVYCRETATVGLSKVLPISSAFDVPLKYFLSTNTFSSQQKGISLHL